jgi:GDPmannose 4,6-dehydratase
LEPAGFLHEQGQFVSQDYDKRIYRSLCDSEGFPKLGLGSIDSARDWGHAEDYVRAMWMMLQQEKPDDYVIATGQAFTVRQFLETAFEIALPGLNYNDFIYVDERFVRPSELTYLCGSAQKASLALGWKPKITFRELVERMVKFDTELALREAAQQKL